MAIAEKTTNTGRGRKGWTSKLRPEGLLILLVLLVLFGAALTVMYQRPTKVLRVMLLTSVNQLQYRLINHKTLPREQYDELDLYLKSLENFLMENELNKQKVLRVQPLLGAFKSTLADGQINGPELVLIRRAAWQANLPLDMDLKSRKK